MAGGGGGIRTHGTLSRTTVFKTVAIDHSATPPSGDGIGKVARFEKPKLAGKRGFSAIQRGTVRLCLLVSLSLALAGRGERISACWRCHPNAVRTRRKLGRSKTGPGSSVPCRYKRRLGCLAPCPGNETTRCPQAEHASSPCGRGTDIPLANPDSHKSNDACGATFIQWPHALV